MCFEMEYLGLSMQHFETQRSSPKVHSPCVYRARRNKKKVGKLSHKFSVLVLTGYSIGTRLDGGGG